MKIKLMLLVVAGFLAFNANAQLTAEEEKALNTPVGEFLGSGISVSYDGTNVGGVSFDRSFGTCVGISGLGPVLGSEQGFTVSVTGA